MTVLNENQSIIYKKADGGVAVIYIQPGAGLTVEEIVSRVIPAGTPWKIVETSSLPPDYMYRDAWEWED
jgi:hypothetical protein